MDDLRLGARRLGRSPGFTLFTAALLAVGIGANAVIFGAFDAVLLRPLPVRRPAELVRMVQTLPVLGTRSNFLYQYYRALTARSTTLAAFGDLEVDTAMTEPAPAEPVRIHLVTGEFFSTLGVAALHGRTLVPDDEKPTEGAPPAVLSYSFWLKRFDGDPRAVGRTIALHGHQFTVVGVTPRTFNGISADTTPDLRVPMRTYPLFARNIDESRLEEAYLELAGRLRPGVSREKAQAECLVLWRQTMTQLRSSYFHLQPSEVEQELRNGMQLEALDRGVSILRNRFAGALEVLVASAGLLQLLLSANLAGLLLARGARRREEMAIRLAVGATRWRLVRQMLAESALVTALGAAGGVLLAWMASPVLLRALPPIRDLGTNRLTLALDLTPDRRVLLFSLALSAATVLLFGLAPALAAARVNLDGVLRGARSSGGWRGLDPLLAFQIGLCTLLLAGAGLLVRTLEHLDDLNPGFDSQHLVSFTANPSVMGYPEDRTGALRLDLLDRVRNLPGVAGAATASRPLLRGSGMKTTVAAAGQPITRADFLNTSTNSVSPEYFDTLGMRIVEGRGFNAADSARVKPVKVVVNETFVQRFFPGADPVGRQFRNGGGSNFEIIGVVSDAKYRSLREPMTPTFYSLAQSGDFVLYVRARARPESVFQPVRRALAALDPALPFTEIHPMAEELAASAAPERLTAALASIFGLLAATLAGVGIYGLFAYAVAERRREIGIRMALGARPGEVGGMIARQALAIAAAGVAPGLLAAVLAARAVRPLLYGVQPSDPQSLVGAAVLVTVVAVAAAAVPAARAARTEPASALRR